MKSMEFMRSYDYGTKDNQRYYIDGKRVTRDVYKETFDACASYDSFSTRTRVTNNRVRHYCVGHQHTEGKKS